MVKKRKSGSRNVIVEKDAKKKLDRKKNKSEYLIIDDTSKANNNRYSIKKDMADEKSHVETLGQITQFNNRRNDRSDTIKRKT